MTRAEHAEHGGGDVVRVAVDFSETPHDVVAERMREILELGWIPERAVFQKNFADDDIVADAAQEELRAVMREHWIEGRTA
jgi:hypothetical protein